LKRILSAFIIWGFNKKIIIIIINNGKREIKEKNKIKIRKLRKKNWKVGDIG
jgi:hypothetical protein